MPKKRKTITTGKVPVDAVLVGAIKAGLKNVLVLGRDEDGYLYAAASSGKDRKNLEMVDEFKDSLEDGLFG
jgi:hypothetical protein